MSDIEKALNNKLISKLLPYAPKDFVLYVTDQEWDDLCKLYEFGKPVNPVVHSVLIKRKEAKS